MSDILRQVQAGLKAHLTAADLSFEAIYDGWPDAGTVLSLPALSIMASNAQFNRSANPVQITQGAVSGNQATSTYQIGDYDLRVQLDIWSKYPVQRSSLYRELFDVFHGPLDGSGLIITLSNYYSQKLALTEISHRLLDDESNTSRQEFRAMVEFEASVNAVVERSEYIITEEPVITFTTPTVIQED